MTAPVRGELTIRRAVRIVTLTGAVYTVSLVSEFAALVTIACIVIGSILIRRARCSHDVENIEAQVAVMIQPYLEDMFRMGFESAMEQMRESNEV